MTAFSTGKKDRAGSLSGWLPKPSPCGIVPPLRDDSILRVPNAQDSRGGLQSAEENSQTEKKAFQPPWLRVLRKVPFTCGMPNDQWGIYPIETKKRLSYFQGDSLPKNTLMTLILLIVVLVLLFGGGGYAYRGHVGGGGGLGLVLIILLVLYLMGYL
jgi:hypothetical protein